MTFNHNLQAFAAFNSQFVYVAAIFYFVCFEYVYAFSGGVKPPPPDPHYDVERSDAALLNRVGKWAKAGQGGSVRPVRPVS